MSDEHLAQITEMAQALLTPEEIGCLLDLPNSDVYSMKSKPDSTIAKAYRKGRLLTKLELRKKIIQLAKMGSPQAEMLADKYLKSK